MPLVLDTPRSGTAAALRTRNCLTIGLVNNMPDAACEATERQFIELIRSAAPDLTVCLKLFSIGEVPRADHVRARLAGRYRDVAQLWEAPLDGLIVTGNEPHAANLKDEPYWRSLTRLVDWGRGHTSSTIWSCLAAHAAVLHADGIERRPFENKLVGIFACDKVADHPLLAGVASPQRMPHSRANDLPAPALDACGYRILTRSPVAGVDTFVREERGASLFVFFQGHPEYEVDSLLREYRRDVGRFLRGEWQNYPAVPHGYFGDAALKLTEAFRARALSERRAGLIGDFPTEALEAGADHAWRSSALRLYRNWIAYLKGRKAERRRSLSAARDSSRTATTASARQAGRSRTA
jgi:homoserine O-succinyltransferase/O-acetyltransferase